MSGPKELIGGICVMGLFFYFIVAGFFHDYNRARRCFILANGERVMCRYFSGNLRYGIDLKDCADGMNRYDIAGEVKEVVP